MTLMTRRRQIAAKIGTEGQFDATMLAAANAAHVVYEPKIRYNVSQFERNPARATFGSLPSIPGVRMASLSFSMDVQGAGTAGVAPAWGKMLRACGASETINTGTASVGAVSQVPGTPGTGAPPAVTGTYTGTKSGLLEITIDSVTTDTELDFSVKFYPGDGTAATDGGGPITQSSASAVSINSVAAGLSVDFGDPSSSTAGYVVGQRFLVRLVSDQEVSVEYAATSESIPCLDMAIYQDGRLHKLHSCRGNVEIVFNEVGEPGRFNFEFMGVPANEDTTSDSSAGIVDAALLTGIAYQDVVPPLFIGVTATLYSATPQCFTQFSMATGNTIASLRCATADAGLTSHRITGRTTTGTINPRAAVVATSNPFSRYFAGTLGNLALIVGSTAGNIVEITAPRVQITDLEDADVDGVTHDVQTLRFCEPNFDPGGDYSEWKIIAR